MFAQLTVKWILEVSWNCNGGNGQIYKILANFLNRCI
jgi:hypothetical protein